MAKNTYSSAFRCLNVDLLNENNFDDSTDKNFDNFEKSDNLNFFNEIGQLLIQNQPAEALICCLENSPQTLRSQTEKVKK